MPVAMSSADVAAKKPVSAVRRILGNGWPAVTAEEMQARKAQALAFDFENVN